MNSKSISVFAVVMLSQILGVVGQSPSLPQETTPLPKDPEIKEVFQQVVMPTEVQQSQIEGTEDCPTILEELKNTTKVGFCFNEMRSSPEIFTDMDPCNWVIFAPSNLEQLILNDDLMSVAQAHAERNSAIQDPTGKFVDVLERFPSQVLSEANSGEPFTSLHVTVQAGPGRGGVFGVVAGWMCVEERREIALSCEFDQLGLGVSYNPEDELYYVVKYQGCSKNVCTC
eukprot:TRINITY_DN13897_c0_g2_i2.p1 TRINITY_DN13897_c0_g2~~TRINITY_DN13897_c0_g2_i2.p1  ORF type:complete len:249 (-),score=39.76 TRINITY_DN13897_c0_g2_i2:566-1249(-)